MLAEREGAFVESFLRAFQLLRTAAQNRHLVQAWLVRVLHAFQSLRLSRKSRFLSKTPPFLFQLSGIGMFLAVLLSILEPPVPPDSRTFRPCSPRLTAHRFVESPLFISNILECHFSHSSTVRSPPFQDEAYRPYCPPQGFLAPTTAQLLQESANLSKSSCLVF